MCAPSCVTVDSCWLALNRERRPGDGNCWEEPASKSPSSASVPWKDQNQNQRIRITASSQWIRTRTTPSRQWIRTRTTASLVSESEPEPDTHLAWEEDSVLMETALNLSSLPPNISSTSVAFKRVMLVARLCGPSPEEREREIYSCDRDGVTLTHSVDLLPLIHCHQSPPQWWISLVQRSSKHPHVVPYLFLSCQLDPHSLTLTSDPM